ncbi:hypothetical protein PIB30_028725 [Stylosanthes scabra]|uniref:Uncharacterized protein n=1 Tax=Stylosanthes scabra TaxID=79078 RepID=A0ABU6VCN0_9FABA|nr:hypothetical protein [Stylosanthes scabra]
MKEVSWLLFITQERLRKNRELELVLAAKNRLASFCVHQRHLLSCRTLYCRTLYRKSFLVADSKRVVKLFYRAHVAVVFEHVKYGSFVVQSDADFSGESNPIPTFVHIGGSLSSAPIAPVVPVIPPCVASPSFAADLHHEDDDGCDMGDNRTFGVLVVTVANSPHNVRKGVQ